MSTIDTPTRIYIASGHCVDALRVPRQSLPVCLRKCRSLRLQQQPWAKHLAARLRWSTTLAGSATSCTKKWLPPAAPSKPLASALC